MYHLLHTCSDTSITVSKFTTGNIGDLVSLGSLGTWMASPSAISQTWDQRTHISKENFGYYWTHKAGCFERYEPDGSNQLAFVQSQQCNSSSLWSFTSSPHSLLSNLFQVTFLPLTERLHGIYIERYSWKCRLRCRGHWTKGWGPLGPLFLMSPGKPPLTWVLNQNSQGRRSCRHLLCYIFRIWSLCIYVKQWWWAYI